MPIVVSKRARSDSRLTSVDQLVILSGDDDDEVQKKNNENEIVRKLTEAL